MGWGPPLDGPELVQTVRAMEAFWIERGVRGVPAMVFALTRPLIGAQGVETYAAALREAAARAT